MVTSAASILGHVYNDLNHNGVFTNGDTGLSGVTLQLFTDPNADGNPSDGALVQMVATDAGGYYELLNLTLGHYVAVETDLPGYASSAPANNRLAFNLTTLTATNGNNFFDYLPSPASYSTISGMVWNDANGNGTNDVAETGLVNVPLDLVQDVNTNGVADSGEPAVASVTTDASGNYSFAGVTPGNYVVRETDLFGYYHTGDAQPPNDGQVAINASGGATFTNIWFLQHLNQSPVATNDIVSVTENVTTTIYPLVNDADPDGNPLIIISVTTTNGTVTYASGTNVLFTPTTNFTGSVTLNYSISDGHGGTASAFIFVTVTNMPPAANPDNYAMTENTTNTFSPLLNDLVNTPGGSLTIIGVSPTNGTATISGTNVIFTPTLNFIGVATIGYTITDNIGGTNRTIIFVTVTNLPPVANPDSYNIAENSGTNIFSPLVNDVVRTPGGSLTIIGVNPTNGTATFTATNVLFVPATNFLGNTTIGYTIIDNVGGTNSGLITVNVTNRPPVAFGQSVSLTENTARNLTLAGSDPISLPLTFIIVSGPANGTMTAINTNTGSVTYLPNTNYLGADTFTFRVNNGYNNSPAATVNLTVTNIPPLANPDSYTVLENSTNVFSPLINDLVQMPGGVLAIVSVSATNGTATISGTNIIFTPANNYSGPATIGYTITDGIGGTNSSIITVTVLPVADIAVVQSGPAGGVAGSNLVFTVTVTNLGPASATNLVVTNQLATGFTFVSASAGGIYGNNLVLWIVPSLAANGVTNLTVTAFAAEGGVFTNRASGAAATLDLNLTNNNGSLTNAQTRTVISALADVQVFKDGGTNVFAGQSVSYVITATNAGPSTATNVVVTETLPAGAIFQGASGSYSTNSGAVTWSSVTLAPGAVVTFNLTLLAPASVSSFLNIAAATSPIADPNPTNNNGSLAKSRVSTKVVPSADLLVLLAGPPSAILGSNIVYTLTVTNAGPSVASNIVVSDSFPTNLLFVSASAGGTSNNHAITWPLIASMPVGGWTNFTFTVKSLTVGVFTEIASALAETSDPNPTNNTGVLPASQAQTTVAVPQFGVLIGTPVFNPQTGLYEEQVTVTNASTITIAGIRLHVGGLPSGITLWNASGTSGGVPFVQYNFPLDPGSTVHFALEFYDPLRHPFTHTLTVEAIIPTNNTASGGSPVAVKFFTDTRTSPTRYILEWPSIPGKTYTVLYSPTLDATNWFVGTPSVTATANVTQWYDDGPPKTMSPPLSARARFYRVIQN